MKRIFTLIQLIVVTYLQSLAQQAPDQKKLTQYLEIQNQRIGFSGTVSISRDGTPILNASVGMSSIEHDVPVSNKTVFPVASISKSFTATLVLLAVAEEKLRLSDSLAIFFPQLVDPWWRSITIEQLLSHRSGIPHNDGIEDYWKEKFTVSFARIPAMKEMFSLKLESMPGSQAKYSSPGYFMLASILENLYNKDYRALLSEKISIPLRLTKTGQMDNKTIIADIATGYLQDPDQIRIAPYRSYSLMKGSGDMYTSAADLIKFLDSFEDQKWLNSLEKELFIAHSNQPVARGDHYGYGWFIRQASTAHPKAYYHGGGSFGVSALMARYPQEKLSIVILSNVSVLPVNEIWSDIEKICLNKPFALPVIRNSRPITAKMIDQHSGIYATADGMQLQVFSAEGKLYAKLGNHSPFELFQEQPLNFYGKKVSIELIFDVAASGKSNTIKATGMGQRYTFTRK
ncbi:serine hydrolase domain-containing protein [Pedobacter psychroterrae]|uniref:Class A beta-lactamase-related serine hydrolase n=1 Tax=Pedobacter psychroterrae TaxID=2530453 RepID=A0A4R0NRU7_9SPHI|nr:serine hydrolase domain-containing protein [Pedobacter psychroterrae]TCD03872.1 class A beta-lactamase-related serine hydrolase [Pedobacter psychroterrae]